MRFLEVFDLVARILIPGSVADEQTLKIGYWNKVTENLSGNEGTQMTATDCVALAAAHCGQADHCLFVNVVTLNTSLPICRSSSLFIGVSLSQGDL